MAASRRVKPPATRLSGPVKRAAVDAGELLVAQAQLEPMRLLAHDAQVARYGTIVVRV